MQISKLQLEKALQYTADSKGYQTVLQGVRVTPSQVMATNGHYLIIEENVIDCQDDTFDAILAADSVKNALKVWPKNQDWLEIDVLKTKVNGHVKFKEECMPTIDKVDGIFPAIDHIVPKDSPIYRTYITPGLLETIGKTLKRYHENTPICLEFPENAMSPIVITVDAVKIVLMPANNRTGKPIGILG